MRLILDCCINKGETQLDLQRISLLFSYIPLKQQQQQQNKH